MAEAKARIKINRLLEDAGWRFFDNEDGPANIILEGKASLSKHELNALGEDFETQNSGFIDFLLLDHKGFPLIVLEAKREERSPLDGKEQARKYARSQNVRFIILGILRAEIPRSSASFLVWNRSSNAVVLSPAPSHSLVNKLGRIMLPFPSTMTSNVTPAG